ncbi:MAG: hypothetical protein CMC82_04845 [Flavobacteriaceae bacterium]|nr:hypothetical protein [Flavobacteriaceae bacterium]|tara:strand:- start:644 stop:904 length:261 start_codon:yes stop_codon:yes gene_type:complete
MNLKLVIALVVITESGAIDPEKKTYFNNPQHCEWIAQEMTRERKYFQGFQEGSIFCRPEWVDAEVKVTRLNVVPLPVEEDDQGLAP